MLLILGGESKDWGVDAQSLTLDVHIAYFTAAFGTWARVYTSGIDHDEKKVECTGATDTDVCPRPRRDAAVKMMGNDASKNGKLLMFGGLAAGPGMTKSVGRAYLEGNTQADLVPLSDLWYLDLEPLTIECVSGVQPCTMLNWIQVDVPGEKPMGRWGPGMVLDPSDNLYIIGGSTLDLIEKEFKVLSDIFIFQLRDPYFKYCSATGAGLQTAIAGIKTPFYIQCRDAFGDPAPSASFVVEITGKEQQPSMKPAPKPDPKQKGLYTCTYTSFRTGLYEVSIFVGRGGSQYLDLIEGIDTEPTNSQHDYRFKPGGDIVDRSKKVFLLSVSPGDTNAKESPAEGNFITGSTAGVIGSFLVTAKDAFGNRRPGGDSVTSIMKLWNEEKNKQFSEIAMPETGSVLDNKDGSYEVTYRITKAGMYQHQVSLGGIVGGGTPVPLFVATDVADVSRTYVYGELKRLETGKASTVFVQTRDMYGNHLRYTDEEKPCEGYPLSDTCDQIIEYKLCRTAEFVEPCPPDSIESSVGLSLAYQVGPDNKAKWPECESSDPGGRYPCGEPYYGLYKITIYPFLADSYIPMVYHNDEYVQCYFDSGGDPDAGDPSLMGTADADPGWELANACVEMNQASKGRRGMAGWASRRNGKWSSVETMGVVSIQNRLALKQDYEEGLSEFGVPAGSRRAVSGISWKETKLEVKQQFKEPNTKVMEYWVTAAPVLCAVIGIVVAILHAAFDFYEYKQDMRIHVSSVLSSCAPAPEV